MTNGKIDLRGMPSRPADKDSGVLVVSGPGGCPFIVDPERPHLGGNFDGGDLGTQYPDDLWPWLIETFGVKSMCDVGCGTGETMRWFSGRGVVSIGVEGLPWNVARCRERGPERVVEHDLKYGPAYIGNVEKLIDEGVLGSVRWLIENKRQDVDLIWCADVAEHIDEEFVDNFVATLTQCRVLAMCQGTEANADEGWGHVNNRLEQYWVDKLAAAGMVEDPALTAESREVGDHGWWEFTGRIYRRRV